MVVTQEPLKPVVEPRGDGGVDRTPLATWHGLAAQRAVGRIERKRTHPRIWFSGTMSLPQVAIRQGGNLHTAPLAGDVDGRFENRDWQTRRVVLRAADFTPQPDFSAAGAAMEFGFGRRDEWRTGTLIQYAVDNWKVSVHHR